MVEHRQAGGLRAFVREGTQRLGGLVGNLRDASGGDAGEPDADGVQPDELSAREDDRAAGGGLQGVRRRARADARGADGGAREAFEKGLYSFLAEAESPETLAERVSELRQKIDRAAWSIRQKKGWD